MPEIIDFNEQQKHKQKQNALNIVSNYVLALAAKDSDGMNKFLAPDFILDRVQGDAFESGPVSVKEVKAFWPVWFDSFSEMDYEVTRTIAAETVVVTQWIFTGTHAKTLGPPVFENPLAPSGRTIRIRGVSIYDINQDRIQRETIYMDLATLLVELGVNYED